MLPSRLLLPLVLPVLLLAPPPAGAQEATPTPTPGGEQQATPSPSASPSA